MKSPNGLKSHAKNKSSYLPSDSHKESDLGLSLDEEGTGGLGVSSGLDESGVRGLILVEVLLSISGGCSSSSGSGSSGSSSALLEGGEQSGISSLLLKNVFWDNPGSEFAKD
jgi:hypothetical protein